MSYEIKCHMSYRKSQWISHFIYYIEYPNSFNSFNAIETDFLSDSPSQKAEYVLTEKSDAVHFGRIIRLILSVCQTDNPPSLV